MEEQEKLEETCRLCDEIGGQMFNIFEKNPEGQQILQVIKDCLPIIVSNLTYIQIRKRINIF